MQRRQVAVALDSSRFAKRADGDDRLPICLSSEAPYQRWWGTEILGHDAEEVDLSYCERGLAFCADHDTERQVGVLEDVSVDSDGCIRGLLRFGAHPDASWIRADMESGVRPYVSVGYRINAMKLMETDDENDTYRVTNWTLFEGSTVSVPADVSVGVGREADRDAFPVQVERPDHLSRRSGAGKEDGMGTQAAPVPAAAGPTADEVRTAEQTRVTDIMQLARDNKLTLEQTEEVLRERSTEAAGLRILRMKQAAGAGSPTPVITGVHDRAGDRPWAEGRAGTEDFLRSIVRAGRGDVDPRLLARSATGVGVSVPSDGGFLMPEPVVGQFMDRIMGPEGGEIMRRVNPIPITVGNSYKLKGFDETSRANGSRYGGIKFAYGDEGDALTATKPKFRECKLLLKKLVGAFYISEEELEDAPLSQAIITGAFEEEGTFVMEDNVVNGLGVSGPLGFMNGGALIAVAKKAAQAADTIVTENILAMASRFGGRWSRAAWLVDQQAALSQLPALTIGTVPVWLPQGQLNSSPYPMMLGAPVIYTEYNAKLGDVGDIVLADLGMYHWGQKGGVRQQSSIHVRFLQDEQIIKFVLRNDGQPGVHTALTPKNGGDTRSPFVTLAERA
jgi:HK97 family phage major capsid protein